MSPVNLLYSWDRTINARVRGIAGELSTVTGVHAVRDKEILRRAVCGCVWQTVSGGKFCDFAVASSLVPKSDDPLTGQEGMKD